MEHAREIDLIELAAQRLAAERQQVVQAHLADCRACRTRLEEITRTWDMLGAWQVQPTRHADPAGLAVSSAPEESRSGRFVLRFPWIAAAVRIAAAVVVGVLGGYAGGRWSVRPVPVSPEVSPPPYVSVLGFDVGDSFSSLVLSEGPAARQEG
jgi:predicted anti-sigma-YlaC factor YlaD